MSIRVEAIKKAVKAAQARQNAYETLEQMIEEAIEAYETAKAEVAVPPVSVSLEKCAEVIHQCHYHPTDWYSKEWRSMFEREKPLAIAMAKACLDAAGGEVCRMI